MNERKNAKRAAIAAKFGMPFWDVVRHFADQGLSRKQTALAIGYQSQQFHKVLANNPDKDPFEAYGTVANYVRDTGEQFSVALKRMQEQGYTWTEAAREIGYTAPSSLKYAMAVRGIELEFSPLVAKPREPKPAKRKAVMKPAPSSPAIHPWKRQAQQELVNRGYVHE